MKPYNKKEQAAVGVVLLAAIALMILAISDINSYAHQERIVPLLNKIVLGVVLLVGVIIHNQRRDKLYLQELYEKMKITETLMHTAVTNSNLLLLFYDISKDELRILNHEKLDVDLPETVEKASKTIVNYFHETENAKMQFDKLYETINEIDDYADFELSLEIDNTVHTYEIHLNSVRNDQGQIVQCVGTAEDITENMSLQREVKMREQFLNNTIGFLAADLNDDCMLQISEKFSQQKNMTYSQFIDFQKLHYVAPGQRAYLEENLSITKLMDAYQKGIHNIELEYQGYDEFGNDIWRECGVQLEQEVGSGHVIAYLVIKNIVADKQREFLLLERANRDYLTGLYNRGGGQEQIDSFLQKQAELDNDNTHVFLILDLDDFKSLNDTFGHQTGDRALQDVANVLNAHFREHDIVCRLAGDEFVVLIKNLPRDVIPKNMGSLLRKLRMDYQRGQQSVHISASLGLSIWPLHGRNFKELYAKADKALYSAKENGKDTYAIYHE